MKIADALEVIRARLGVPAEAWIVGADRLAADESGGFARPRYVWVPTLDSFGPPERTGGNPRQLLTRFAGLELHLWTDTLEDAEQRLNNVVCAWLAEANTSVMFDSINWTGESAIDRGFLSKLGMRVKVPITAPALRTVRPTKAEHDASSAAAGDGNLDAGETT